jgi:hypothetical protein
MPSFLHHLENFGEGDKAEEFNFIGLRVEIPKRNLPGCRIQFCYSFRYVVEPATAKDQWYNQQSAIYYSFCPSSRKSVWIIVDGNDLVKSFIMAENLSPSPFLINNEFLNSLSTHSRLCNFAMRNWNRYISYLNGLSSSLILPLNKNDFLDYLQRNIRLQKMVLNVVECCKHNMNGFNELARNCSGLHKDGEMLRKQPDDMSWVTEVKEFERDISLWSKRCQELQYWAAKLGEDLKTQEGIADRMLCSCGHKRSQVYCLLVVVVCVISVVHRTYICRPG